MKDVSSFSRARKKKRTSRWDQTSRLIRNTVSTIIPRASRIARCILETESAQPSATEESTSSRSSRESWMW